MTEQHAGGTVGPMNPLHPTTQPSWIDWLLATSVAVAGIAGTLVVVTPGSGRPFDALWYVLMVAIAAPIVIRDRYPVPALLTVAVLCATYTLLGYPGGFYTVALFFVIWAAAAAGQRIPAIAVAAGVVAVLVLAGPLVARGHALDSAAPLWLGGWLVASLVLGEVSRGRRQYLAQVEQRALEAERTREEEARRRAGEERMRIARELHDVLAHNISMINVQAGVAVHLLDKQPDQARSALVAISQASKEALAELRATLGVLRSVDEAEPRNPVPGLARLDELVEHARASGLEVSVAIDNAALELPAGTDLAAFRIIQESLTNVTRHARARSATIAVRRSPSELEITVDDDGAGAPTDPLPGNGISGMRERATAAGGRLEVGPRPTGGFRVRALLPLRATP